MKSWYTGTLTKKIKLLAIQYRYVKKILPAIPGMLLFVFQIQEK